MRFSDYLAQSEIVSQLNPRQSLGLFLETCPLNEIHEFSLPNGPTHCLRAEVAQVLRLQDQIDESTLVLIDDVFLNFQKHQIRLKEIKCFDKGLVVNPSYEGELNSDLILFDGFFMHFPICETSKDAFYTLDELYRLLIQAPGNFRSPTHYQIFNPIWKYTASHIPLPFAESNFHTSLDVDFYPQAFIETHIDSSFRSKLLKSSRAEELIFSLLFPTANALSKTLGFRPSNSLPLLDSFKKIWLRYIYWPIEYHYRTRKSPMEKSEYEALKTQEIETRSAETLLKYQQKRSKQFQRHKEEL